MKNGYAKKVPLGSVGDFRAGFGFPPRLQGRTCGDYPFAKVGDISAVARTGASEISTAGHYVDESDLSTLKAKPLPSGTIVFAKIGEAIRQNFRAVTTCEMLIDNNAMGLVPNESVVNQRYLFHFMCQIDLYQYTAATTVPALRKSTLETIEIPLPPLSEQRRIAAILDKADAVRRKRREAVTGLDSLSDSLFTQLAREFRIEPKTIAALIESQTLIVHKDGNYGGSYPRKHEFGDSGIPFLSAKHLSNGGTLIMDDVPLLDEAKARTLPFGWIEHGDVLLAHNATVGPVAIYRGEYDEALIGTSLTCYRPNPEALNSEFLYAALRGSHFQRQLQKAMSQTTRNQVPITAQRRLSIHTPALSVQHKFSEQLESIHRIRRKNMEALVETSTLFNSLVQRAFSGELQCAIRS